MISKRRPPLTFITPVPNTQAELISWFEDNIASHFLDAPNVGWITDRSNLWRPRNHEAVVIASVSKGKAYISIRERRRYAHSPEVVPLDTLEELIAAVEFALAL